MRSKMTVLFLGLREQLHNPDFKLQFKMEAGLNAFVLPPQTWIEGIISKAGRYGRTYAHDRKLLI